MKSIIISGIGTTGALELLLWSHLTGTIRLGLVILYILLIISANGQENRERVIWQHTE